MLLLLFLLLLLQGIEGAEKWTSNFTRVVYARSDRVDRVLIDYIGDEQVAAQLPHGNTSLTGRKRPRVADIDMVAATDIEAVALAATQDILNEFPSSVSQSMCVRGMWFV